jgi:hypothetical protein
VSAISPATRAKIKELLEFFVDRAIEQQKTREIPTFDDPRTYLSTTSLQPKLKPFHAALIPQEVLKINEFERSFSTTLGTTFEEAARLIALEHHAEAYRGFEIQGEVSNNALQEIERQTAVFERAAKARDGRPSLESMIEAVLNARDTGKVSIRTARSDLYMKTHDGAELFFEIKSPAPNKDQCLSMTQRILRHHLIRGLPRPQVQSYFAMAYNPYGPEREDYRWSVAKMYLPFEQATVIGHEFWNIVGGPTAYEELLDIYHEVGRDKSKHIIDSLAIGF